MKDRTLEELIEMLVKQYEVNGCSFNSIERFPIRGDEWRIVYIDYDINKSLFNSFEYLPLHSEWYIVYIDGEGIEKWGEIKGTPRKAIEAELIRLAAVNRERIEARLKEIDAEIAGLVSERGLLALAFNKNDG